jgi:hypothetical protein
MMESNVDEHRGGWHDSPDSVSKASRALKKSYRIFSAAPSSPVPSPPPPPHFCLIIIHKFICVGVPGAVTRVPR